MENHYVPQFYTKRWAGLDGRLFSYRRPYRQVISDPKFPVQVAFEEDLYRVPFVPDDVKDLLETKFFKRIDQEGSDVIAKLEKTGPDILTQTERFSWAIFLVALMQRHPIQVQHLAQSTENNIKRLLEAKKDRYYRDRKENDMRSFEDFLLEVLESEQTAQQKKIAIQSGILIPRTITWIGNASMAVADFDRGHTLLTSDRPVVMTNGLIHQHSHIALPIGPRRLFVAAQSVDVLRQILTQNSLIERLNDIVVRQAEEFVFGSDSSHLAFVERRLKKTERQRCAGRGRKKRKDSAKARANAP